jgi:hypothetical protein
MKNPIPQDVFLVAQLLAAFLWWNPKAMLSIT